MFVYMFVHVDRGPQGRLDLSNWASSLNKVIIIIIINFVIKIVFLSILMYILGAGGMKIVPRFLLMEFIKV